MGEENSVSGSQVGACIGQHRGSLKPQGGSSMLKAKAQYPKPAPGRVLRTTNATLCPRTREALQPKPTHQAPDGI